jgi:hypothetical protein
MRCGSVKEMHTLTHQEHQVLPQAPDGTKYCIDCNVVHTASGFLYLIDGQAVEIQDGWVHNIDVVVETTTDDHDDGTSFHGREDLGDVEPLPTHGPKCNCEQCILSRLPDTW